MLTDKQKAALDAADKEYFEGRTDATAKEHWAFENGFIAALGVEKGEPIVENSR